MSEVKSFEECLTHISVLSKSSYDKGDDDDLSFFALNNFLLLPFLSIIEK